MTLLSASTALRAEEALPTWLGTTAVGDLTLSTNVGLENEVSPTKPACVPSCVGEAVLEFTDSF